MDITIWTL